MLPFFLSTCKIRLNCGEDLATQSWAVEGGDAVRRDSVVVAEVEDEGQGNHLGAVDLAQPKPEKRCALGFVVLHRPAEVGRRLSTDRH